MNGETKYFDTNASGTRDIRMAEVDGKFYVFAFSTETAQATPVEGGTSYDYSPYSKVTGAGAPNVANAKSRKEAEEFYEELRAKREVN